MGLGHAAVAGGRWPRLGWILPVSASLRRGVERQRSRGGIHAPSNNAGSGGVRARAAPAGERRSVADGDGTAAFGAKQARGRAPWGFG